MIPAIVWRLDPDTWAVLGGPQVLTEAQVAASRWPTCPVCGTTIEVDLIDVTTWMRPVPREYLIGRWECRNGCDPRDSDPRYIGR